MMMSNFILITLSTLVVHGDAQIDLFEGSGLQKALTMTQWTSVSDGSDEEVAAVNVTVSVWGEYEPFQDNMVVVDFITDKMAYIENHPEEFSMDLETQDYQLPLQGTLSATQVIMSGPQSNRTLGLKLDVNVYSANSHHSSTTFKTISSTLKQTNALK